MKRKTKLYIGDILENIELLEKITTSLKCEDFIANIEKKYAAVRCVEIIGEAAKNVPEHIRASCPNVPWRLMAGMRDKVIHFYLGVDYELVWRAATVDLPALKPLLHSIFIEIDD